MKRVYYMDGSFENFQRIERNEFWTSAKRNADSYSDWDTKIPNTSIKKIETVKDLF